MPPVISSCVSVCRRTNRSRPPTRSAGSWSTTWRPTPSGPNKACPGGSLRPGECLWFLLLKAANNGVSGAGVTNLFKPKSYLMGTQSYKGLRVHSTLPISVFLWYVKMNYAHVTKDTNLIVKTNARVTTKNTNSTNSVLDAMHKGAQTELFVYLLGLSI